MKKRISIMLISLLMCASLMISGCNQNADTESEKLTANDANVTEAEKTQENEFKPKMWKVTDKDGNTAYLLGSAHNTDESVREFPDYFEKAYDECDYVGFEIETTSSAPYHTNREYADGTTIQDHVSKEAYDFAKAKLSERGLYNKSMESVKPAEWTHLLQMVQQIEQGYVQGVESVLLPKARADLKQTISLESTETHFDFLYSMPDDVQEWQFEFMANEETFNSDMGHSNAYEKWENGTIEAEDVMPDLKQIEDKELAQKYEKWFIDINTVRNKEMAETIVKTMKDGKKLLAIAGVAHFVCDNNIPQCLENLGCIVEEYNG